MLSNTYQVDLSQPLIIRPTNPTTVETYQATGLNEVIDSSKLVARIKAEKNGEMIARLFAAAPDLYNALSSLDEILDFNSLAVDLTLDAYTRTQIVQAFQQASSALKRVDV